MHLSHDAVLRHHTTFLYRESKSMKQNTSVYFKTPEFSMVYESDEIA